MMADPDAMRRLRERMNAAGLNRDSPVDDIRRVMNTFVAEKDSEASDVETWRAVYGALPGTT